MTQHTAEPWKLLNVPKVNPRCHMKMGRLIIKDGSEADVVRAAACVNALAGIRIEAIESGVVAELASALKLWRDYDDCDEADFGSISPMLAYANAISATRDVLAKLENGND